jgi:hypothetical protein
MAVNLENLLESRLFASPSEWGVDIELMHSFGKIMSDNVICKSNRMGWLTISIRYCKLLQVSGITHGRCA